MPWSQKRNRKYYFPFFSNVVQIYVDVLLLRENHFAFDNMAVSFKYITMILKKLPRLSKDSSSLFLFVLTPPKPLHIPSEDNEYFIVHKNLKIFEKIQLLLEKTNKQTLPDRKKVSIHHVWIVTLGNPDLWK